MVIRAKVEMLESFWAKLLFELQMEVVQARDKDSGKVTQEIGKVPERVSLAALKYFIK